MVKEQVPAKIRKYHIEEVGEVWEKNAYLMYGQPKTGHKHHLDLEVGEETTYYYALSCDRGWYTVRRVF